MYLRNVGIFVKDLEGAKAFFESYFGAKVLKTYDNPEKNYYSYIMHMDGAGWIELMCKPETVDLPKDPNRLGLAHICICADTREQLNTIIARFKEDGYLIQYEPSSPEGPGEVRAVTFEDIVIEVNYGY
ncbi:MAG: VOC family protein [Firmicutes bacterium]|nr:VOC family protein [Bacillota bacterium]